MMYLLKLMGLVQNKSGTRIPTKTTKSIENKILWKVQALSEKVISSLVKDDGNLKIYILIEQIASYLYKTTILNIFTFK